MSEPYISLDLAPFPRWRLLRRRWVCVYGIPRAELGHRGQPTYDAGVGIARTQRRALAEARRRAEAKAAMT